MNQILPKTPEHAGLRLRPITVADFLRMIGAGILTKEDRVELIDGQLVEMSPIGNPHIDAVNKLTRALVLAVGDRAVVSI